MTIAAGRLLVFTWRSGVAFVLDTATLEALNEIRAPIDVWGATYDGTSVIISNGSDVLQFLDPGDLSLVSRIQVTQQGQPVTGLNELEFVGGKIYANVLDLRAPRIVQIELPSGMVHAEFDLAHLEARMIGQSSARRGAPPGTHAANGIAYDAVTGRMVVTGKGWPRVVELIPPRSR